jgi:hypothetical protein
VASPAKPSMSPPAGSCTEAVKRSGGCAAATDLAPLSEWESTAAQGARTVRRALGISEVWIDSR